MELTGPVIVDCEDRCEIPAGITVAVLPASRVPKTRCKRVDLTICPTPKCDRAFYVVEAVRMENPHLEWDKES
jgi:hypothetical protein